MTTNVDREFFLRRAREERLRTAQSTDDGVASIHRNMADEYERRAAETASIVWHLDATEAGKEQGQADMRD